MIFFFFLGGGGGGGGVKIIDLQNDSISVALPFNKNFTTEVRRKLDLEFCFGSKSIKSLLLTQKLPIKI